MILGVDSFEKTYFTQVNTDAYWMTKAMAGLYAMQVVTFVTIELVYRSEPTFFNKSKPTKIAYLPVEK